MYAFPPVIEAIKQNAEAELHPLYLPDYTEGANSTKPAGDAAAEAALRGFIAQQRNTPAWQMPLSIFCSVKVIPFLE